MQRALTVPICLQCESLLHERVQLQDIGKGNFLCPTCKRVRYLDFEHGYGKINRLIYANPYFLISFILSMGAILAKLTFILLPYAVYLAPVFVAIYALLSFRVAVGVVKP